MRIVERITTHSDQNDLSSVATDHLREVENGEILIVKAISQHNAITALKGQEAGTAFCKDF